jgi:hypothetical protein
VKHSLNCTLISERQTEKDKVNNMEHTFEKKLENIKSICVNDLIERVIDDALDHGEDAQWLEDVRQYGCQSGSVSGLIYYTDTAKFFEEFYDEIQDAFFDYSESIGEQPKIQNGDIKNWFAWFGYEWAVGQVLDRLENYKTADYDEEEDEEEDEEKVTEE